MNDLISRQAAIDALMAWEEDSIWDEECLKHRGEPYWNAPSDVIEQLPSADAAPVRHGHWIKISPAGIYECSECQKNVMTSDIEAYEYCHGCGARMDGGDDDEKRQV